MFGQNTAGVPGGAERGDTSFGAASTPLDTGHDGRADLVVGSPGENSDAGSVTAVRSTASGVTGAGSVSCGAGPPGTDPYRARLGDEFANRATVGPPLADSHHQLTQVQEQFG